MITRITGAGDLDECNGWRWMVNGYLYYQIINHGWSLSIQQLQMIRLGKKALNLKMDHGIKYFSRFNEKPNPAPFGSLPCRQTGETDFLLEGNKKGGSGGQLRIPVSLRPSPWAKQFWLVPLKEGHGFISLKNEFFPEIKLKGPSWNWFRILWKGCKPLLHLVSMLCVER